MRPQNKTNENLNKQLFVLIRTLIHSLTHSLDPQVFEKNAIFLFLHCRGFSILFTFESLKLFVESCKKKKLI